MTKKQKSSELTVFLPERKDTSGISVIICPGGSYYWLDMDNEGYAVAKRLNESGITAFVLRYRTAKKDNCHPAMIQDLQRAMQLIRENWNTYGIDSAKVGVMGFSAGGHLAGMAAAYFDTNFMETLHIHPDVSLKPYFVAMIYPVVSMSDSIAHKKSRKNLLSGNYTPQLQNQLSLEQNARSDMPPVFLLHCVKDRTVDYRNSLYLQQALREKGVKHQFFLFEQPGHGFGIKPKDKATNWINEFINWLKTI
ncbi:MAG: alpha/beta hydrolase [Tannerella sp.]|nr:alpha/beta hydrolase [Tannerella sp.]